MKLADQTGSWPVHRRRILASGAVASFVEDDVETPDGQVITRQYLVNPGAVAVIAIDEADRVCCLRQYRHPLGTEFLEIPAGLLDVAGEPAVVAAQRELAEEVELAAGTWHTLVDFASSPGGSAELIRIFVATDVRPTPRPAGFVLEGEEAHLQVGWVPLDELMAGVLLGTLSSPTLVAGISALSVARATGATLRPPDAPWPIRAAIEPRLVEVLPRGR